jgi:protein regulator of cytokinesis 1
MRDLMPPPELEPPVNHYRSAGLSASIVRHVEPEDVYDDRYSYEENNRPASRDYYKTSVRSAQSSYPDAPAAPPPVRQISNNSSHSSSTSTVVTGSENWETYDDNSEPEEDLSDAYFARLRAARAGSARPQSGLMKRQRAVPPTGAVMVDQDGNRIISAS